MFGSVSVLLPNAAAFADVFENPGKAAIVPPDRVSACTQCASICDRSAERASASAMSGEAMAVQLTTSFRAMRGSHDRSIALPALEFPEKSDLRNRFEGSAWAAAAWCRAKQPIAERRRLQAAVSPSFGESRGA